MRQPVTEDVKTFFDNAYRAHKRYWYARNESLYSTDLRAHSDSLVNRLTLLWAKRCKPGTILDVGAGEGSKGLRLAHLAGWELDCLDVSEVACEKLTSFGKQAGIRPRVQNIDYWQFKCSKQYDIILLHGVLHYLGDAISVIEHAKNYLRPGGAISFCGFTSHSPLPSEHAEIGAYLSPTDSHNQLKQLGWHGTIYYEIRKTEQSHGEMTPHRHSFVKGIISK